MPAGRNGEETAGGRALEGRRGICRKVETLFDAAGEGLGLGPGDDELEEAAEASVVDSGALPLVCGRSDVDGEVGTGEVGEEGVSFGVLDVNVAGESDNTDSFAGSCEVMTLIANGGGGS